MAVQVAGNQKKETSKVKSIKKAKSFKKQEEGKDSKTNDLMEVLGGEKNINSTMEAINTINSLVPTEKRKEIAYKIVNEVYSANNPPTIGKVYETSNKGADGEFIRIVRTSVNGRVDYSKGCVLEKYNFELDCWEEYQEKELTLEEIKKEINTIHIETYSAGADIGAVSKMLDRLPDSSEREILDADGLRFLGKALKERSELICSQMERLCELEYEINLPLVSKEV